MNNSESNFSKFWVRLFLKNYMLKREFESRFYLLLLPTLYLKKANFFTILHNKLRSQILNLRAIILFTTLNSVLKSINLN